MWRSLYVDRKESKICTTIISGGILKFNKEIKWMLKVMGFRKVFKNLKSISDMKKCFPLKCKIISRKKYHNLMTLLGVWKD
jgi:hypothetical protein